MYVNPKSFLSAPFLSPQQKQEPWLHLRSATRAQKETTSLGSNSMEGWVSQTDSGESRGWTFLDPCHQRWIFPPPTWMGSRGGPLPVNHSIHCTVPDSAGCWGSCSEPDPLQWGETLAQTGWVAGKKLLQTMSREEDAQHQLGRQEL